MDTTDETVAPTPKSEWTSLEKAKLVASCATPLLIFVFGVIVTTADRKAETNRRKDEIAAVQLREDRLAAAAQRREDRASGLAAERLAADRRATLLREVAQREEARKDAREASLIAFQREQVLIDRSAAREEASRVRERREDQVDKILDKRKEIWKEVQLLANSARWALRDLEANPDASDEDREDWLDEVQYDLSKTREVMAVYDSYFSRQFIAAFATFEQSVARTRSYFVQQKSNSAHQKKISDEMEAAYIALMVLSEAELARVEGGDAERAWARARRPTVLDDY